MFAPHPLEPDGWYVILGTRADGTQREIWRGRAVDDSIWQKPTWREINAQYPSERWAVYMMDLHKPEMREHWPLFGEYLCRRERGMQVVEIHFVERVNPLDRAPGQPVRPIGLWSHVCFLD
jgi:hypothetical protein